jgi:hypothetical protein
MTQLTLFGSTVSSTSVIGLEVRLWRPCQCGAPTALIETSSGLARLECSRCGNYRGYLTDEACDFISAVVAKFGRPDTPILVNPKNSRISANEPVV